MKFIAEISAKILLTILFCLIQYFAIPLNSDNAGKFMIFGVTAILLHMTGAGLRYFLGGLAWSSEEDLIISGAVSIPLMMLAGYFSNIETVFKGFNWLKYFSPHNYRFEYIVLNEYIDLKLDDNALNPVA